MIDVIVLVSVRRPMGDLSQTWQELLAKLPDDLVRPAMWKPEDGPTHDLFTIQVPDSEFTELKDLAEKERINFFPFCDNDGDRDAVIRATLVDYGLVIHKD